MALSLLSPQREGRAHVRGAWLGSTGRPTCTAQGPPSSAKNVIELSGVELRCQPGLFSSEYASSPTSVGIRTFGVGWSLLGDPRFERWSICPLGHLVADDPAHRPLPKWEGCFIPMGGELVRTPDLTLVVPRGMVESYNGRAVAAVWGEGVACHTTLMACGGAGQCRTRSPPPRMLDQLPTWSLGLTWLPPRCYHG
ncbi:hypothetical protein BHE74_00002003 [Ensete ventricosum]|nr:hypothetical protein BHE74_00002003 [Ensete ventricosum]